MATTTDGVAGVQATTALALRGVLSRSTSAGDLLNVLAFLGAEPIPRRMLLQRPSDAGSPAIAALEDHGALNESVGVLKVFGLIQTPGVYLAVHAEIQAAVRARLDPAGRRHWAIVAGQVVAGTIPPRPREPATWSWCTEITPHALAVVAHLAAVDDVATLAPLAEGVADYLAAIGRFDRARTLLEKAIEVAVRVEPSARIHASLLSRLGGVLADLGDLSAAARMVEKALEVHQRDPGQESREVADDLARLARIQRELPRRRVPEADDRGPDQGSVAERGMARARRNGEQALEIHRSVLGADSAEVAEDLTLLAEIELHTLDVQAGLRRLQEAIEVLVRRQGEDDPEVVSRRSVAAALQEGIRRGRLEAAAFEDFLAHVETQFGPDHFEVAEACRTLSWLLAPTDPEGALAKLVRARVIDERVYGKGHPKTANDQFLLFGVAARLSDPETATAALRGAAEWMRDQPPGEADVAGERARMADGLSLVEGIPEESQVLERALALVREVCGSDHPAQIPLLRQLAAAVERESSAISDHRTLRGKALDRAEGYLTRALELARAPEAVGDLTSALASLFVARADLVEAGRRPETAGQVAEEVQALWTAALEALATAIGAHADAFGPNSLAVAGDLITAVPLLLKAGMISRASAAADSSLAIFERVLGAEHPEVAHLRAAPVMAELLVQAEIDRGDEALENGDLAGARDFYLSARVRADFTETLADDAQGCVRLAFVTCLQHEADGFDDASDVASAFVSEAVALWRRATVEAPAWFLVADSARLMNRFGTPPSFLATIAPFVIGDQMTTFRPVLSAGLVEGWLAKESITLVAPDGSANVIASSEPVDLSFDTERFTTVQGDILAELPGFTEASIEATEVLGSRLGYIRRFSWTPDDGAPVTQIQLYCVDGGRGYTATATTPSERFAAAEPVLRQILASLILDSDN